MAETLTTSEYTVAGMSCAHCVAAVSEEVGAVPGVLDLQVDLATGRLSITSEGPLDDAAVRAAIVDAGYEVAS